MYKKSGELSEWGYYKLDFLQGLFYIGVVQDQRKLYDVQRYLNHSGRGYRKLAENRLKTTLTLHELKFKMAIIDDGWKVIMPADLKEYCGLFTPETAGRFLSRHFEKILIKKRAYYIVKYRGKDPVAWHERNRDKCIATAKENIKQRNARLEEHWETPEIKQQLEEYEERFGALT